MKSTSAIISYCVLAALPHTLAFAGPGASGGGNAVVCFDSSSIPAAIRDPKSSRFGQILDQEISEHVTSIQAYDLYEAQMSRGVSDSGPAQLIPVEAGETPRQYAEKIAKRFAPYVPAISKTIRYGSTALSDANILQRPAGLTPIHDENDIGYIDSANCVVATMAAQYSTGSTTFLQIDSRLFNHPRHSRLSRAVLFLHESVYFAARQLAGHEDSRNTRTLVGAIINQTPIDSAWLIQLYTDLRMPRSEEGSFIADWFWDQWPELKGNVDSEIALTAFGDANSKLVKRYNSWIARYSPKAGSSFGDDRDFLKPLTANANGQVPYFGSATQWQRGRFDKGQTCSNGWTRKHCWEELQSILSDYQNLELMVLGSAQQALTVYLDKTLFPKLGSLDQYAAETRATFQTVIAQELSKIQIAELNQFSPYELHLKLPPNGRHRMQLSQSLCDVRFNIQ